MLKNIIIGIFCFCLAVIIVNPETVTKPLAAYKRISINSGYEKVKTTEFFAIHFNNNTPELQKFILDIDRLVNTIDARFFIHDYNLPMDVYVLNDKYQYLSFIETYSEEGQILDNGFYVPELRALFTFDGAGAEGIARELFAVLFKATFKRAPAWAQEGIPCVFAGFYGYRNGNSLKGSWGYPNYDEIKKLKGDFQQPDIEDIIRKPSSRTNRALVALFLYQKGNFLEFIESLKDNYKDEFSTCFEYAFAEEFSSLRKHWDSYMNSMIYKSRNAGPHIPSQIFTTEDDFVRFMEFNDLEVNL